jgi:hypothetical protein
LASEAAQWRSKAARMFPSSFIVFPHIAVQGMQFTPKTDIRRHESSGAKAAVAPWLEVTVRNPGDLAISFGTIRPRGSLRSAILVYRPKVANDLGR